MRREAYGDWTFPKGKLKRGESEAEAAVREVEEETGLRCPLGPELGTTRYRDPKDRPKTVRYWEMTGCEGELSANHEIDEARWVPIEEARALLTYPRDRALLDAAVRRSLTRGDAAATVAPWPARSSASSWSPTSPRTSTATRASRSTRAI